MEKKDYYYKGKTRYYYGNCENCGKYYEGVGKKFCSHECSIQYRKNHHIVKRNMIVKKCKTCGKKFKVFLCNKNAKYCSKKCFYKSRVGHIVSTITRKKIGSANSGENNGCYGKDPWNKNMKFPDKCGDNNNSSRPEARKKISEKMTGENNPMFGKFGKEHHNFSSIMVKCDNCGKELLRPQNRIKSNKYHFCNHKCYAEWLSNNRSGENCPQWLNGISFEPYGLEFNKKLKEQIRKRDNYRCQQCFRHQDELFKNTKAGLRPCRLYIHHIDYNKRNNNPDNLISLCNSCHAQTNFKRENWTNYFKNKIKNYGKS